MCAPKDTSLLVQCWICGIILVWGELGELWGQQREQRGWGHEEGCAGVCVVCLECQSLSACRVRATALVQTNGNFILASKKWDSSTREFLVHSCVFHIAAEAPWPRNFVFLQGQWAWCDPAGRTGLELLGFQFLALNPREREECWCSILAWIILNYVTLQQGSLSELTKKTQPAGEAESQRAFPALMVPGSSPATPPALLRPPLTLVPTSPRLWTLLGTVVPPLPWAAATGDECWPGAAFAACCHSTCAAAPTATHPLPSGLHLSLCCWVSDIF